MAVPKIEVHPTPEALACAAADHIVVTCREVLEQQEMFSLCLAGGSTPKRAYELLASREFSRRIDWPRVEIFFGDERCVAPEHPESNYAMAKAALMDRVPIPGDNIYRMKGELEPEAAAKEYGQMLKQRFGDGGLDLLLLGMGEDGHTLSLFPRTSALQEKEHRCVANFIAKLRDGKGAWRLTLTPLFANRSQQVLALVSGASKAAAVREVLEGDADTRDCPMKLIDPGEGRFAMLVDAAAAEMA